MNAIAPITYDQSYYTTVANDELRTLIRIATELRDPSLKQSVWVQNLAAKCGLDLSDPEGSNARRAAA